MKGYPLALPFTALDATMLPLMTLAGITSIGWMTMVNFFINSNFKWVLLVLALLWGSALALFGLERRISNGKM